MTGVRATETLSVPHKGEITAMRPGRMALRINSNGTYHVVEVEQERVTLGASGDACVVLKDSAVSGIHCELTINRDGAMLRDCTSKNGTFYNDVSIREIWLNVGQGFRVGNTNVLLSGVEDIEVAVSALDHFGPVLGAGPKMGELFARLYRVADTELDVLLTGEQSTGKRLIAQTIHDRSQRCHGPFTSIDCSILEEAYVGAVLFGASGLLRQSAGGTVLLEEVTALPEKAQARLARTLEDRAVTDTRDGIKREIDVRVIASSSADIAASLANSSMSRELLHRLASVRLEVPALRDRGEPNVAMLSDHFLAQQAAGLKKNLTFERSVYELLTNHAWLGNVCELYRAIEAAALLTAGSEVTADDVPLVVDRTPRPVPAIGAIVPPEEIQQTFEMKWPAARARLGHLYATYVMTKCGGSKVRSAEMAGVHRNTFRHMLEEGSDESD